MRCGGTKRGAACRARGCMRGMREEAPGRKGDLGARILRRDESGTTYNSHSKKKCALGTHSSDDGKRERRAIACGKPAEKTQDTKQCGRRSLDAGHGSYAAEKTTILRSARGNERAPRHRGFALPRATLRGGLP